MNTYVNRSASPWLEGTGDQPDSKIYGEWIETTRYRLMHYEV